MSGGQASCVVCPNRFYIQINLGFGTADSRRPTPTRSPRNYNTINYLHIAGSQWRKQWNKVTDSKWLKRINCYCPAHSTANTNWFKHIISNGDLPWMWKLLEPLVFAWPTLRTSRSLIIEIIDMLRWIFIKSIRIIFSSSSATSTTSFPRSWCPSMKWVRFHDCAHFPEKNFSSVCTHENNHQILLNCQYAKIPNQIPEFNCLQFSQLIFQSVSKWKVHQNRNEKCISTTHPIPFAITHVWFIRLFYGTCYIDAEALLSNGGKT